MNTRERVTPAERIYALARLHILGRDWILTGRFDNGWSLGAALEQ